ELKTLTARELRFKENENPILVSMVLVESSPVSPTLMNRWMTMKPSASKETDETLSRIHLQVSSCTAGTQPLPAALPSPWRNLPPAQHPTLPPAETTLIRPHGPFKRRKRKHRYGSGKTQAALAAAQGFRRLQRGMLARELPEPGPARRCFTA
ncbi:hypothetical protein P7K49_012221, partial [Saguinus oedipus]